MSTTREVETIHGDSGTILLGAQEAAEAFVAAEYGEGYAIKDIGWMHNVGWDRENYERKRDFIAESGYGSWWEGCLPPVDGVETKNARPAWELVRPSRREAHREAKAPR